MEQVDLWIDDVREMPDGYNVHAKNSAEGLVIVEKAVAGSLLLRSVSFDHDLGGTDDAYIVACRIEQEAYAGRLPQLTWNIHSMNSVGCRRIRAAMESAEKAWTNQ